MVGMSKAKMENRVLPKRFYRAVAAQQLADGWGVALDGKVLKTPAKNALCVAAQTLAEAIAAEWDAQAEFVQPEAMPLMRLASLTIDRASADRAAWIDDMLRYGETDLLCYRAPAGEALGDEQRARFDPILHWLAEQYGIGLDVTDGIMPIAQHPDALVRLRALLMEANDAEITALAMIVPLLGSVVLAVALWKQHVALDDALIAARLDEIHHARQWGEDEEAQAFWALKEKDIRACAFFLTCN
jgi:chaperone required for assembly of F1-ATPase